MGCAESRPQPGGQGISVSSREERQGKEAKVVLLGDSGVGKSSLALRFCQGRFSPYHEVTIGAAFLQQIVRLPDGNQLKLHIWDTGGQERFRAMAPLYYRDAMGAVIVYDCTDKNSYDAVKYWADELRNKGPGNCALLVAANKSDVDAENKVVDPEVAKQFCDENKMLFVETSAKTGDNVSSAFQSLAIRIAEIQKGAEDSGSLQPR